MGLTKIVFAASLTMAFALISPTQVSAHNPAADKAMGQQNAEMMQKRQAVQGVTADAMAILAALNRDPTLARQLAARPEAAKELLAARGATRAEAITVTPGGDGDARTITITITIDHVTITITIRL